MPHLFEIAPNEIRSLIDPMGEDHVADPMAVDGFPVGYTYGESADSKVDSGWRSSSGEESRWYVDDAQNVETYDVNAIPAYDPGINPYLEAPHGAGFERVEGTSDFLPIDDEEMGGI